MSTETMAQKIQLHYHRGDVGYSKAEVQKMAAKVDVTLAGVVCTFSDGSTQDVTTSATWTTSDNSILIVGTGFGMAVATGTATVTANIGSVQATTFVTESLGHERHVICQLADGQL